MRLFDEFNDFRVLITAVTDELKNSSRGMLDKNLFLLLLFLKSTSALKKRAESGDKLLIQWPLTLDYDNLYHQRHEAGLSNRVESAVQLLESLNPDKLNGISALVDLRYSNQGHYPRDLLVREMLEAVSHLAFPLRSLFPLDYAKIFRVACAVLYSDPRRDFGETPEVLTSMMARLLDPKPHETIYDPACGTGGMLFSCVSYLESASPDSFNLVGLERYFPALVIARMNLCLGNINFYNIDTPNKSSKNNIEFASSHQFADVAICSPPWGIRISSKDQEHYGISSNFLHVQSDKLTSEFVYLTHMLSSIRGNTGRIAILVPNGPLFRGGGEKEVRRQLVEMNVLDTVISLPPKIFPFTAIETNVLILKAARTDSRVFFIDASRDYEAGRVQNHLGNESIEKIYDTFQSRIEDPSYSRLVEGAELKQYDFDLTVKTYVTTEFHEELKDLGHTRQRREQLQKKVDELECEIRKLTLD